VVAATSTEEYIKDKNLPIAVALGDNSAAWQKFARETLGLEANVCQMHATAIAANNGSHKKFFDDVNKLLTTTSTTCSHCLMAGAACDPRIQVPSGCR
jgi:hypothetical protein